MGEEKRLGAVVKNPLWTSRMLVIKLQAFGYGKLYVNYQEVFGRLGYRIRPKYSLNSGLQSIVLCHAMVGRFSQKPIAPFTNFTKLDVRTFTWTFRPRIPKSLSSYTKICFRMDWWEQRGQCDLHWHDVITNQHMLDVKRLPSLQTTNFWGVWLSGSQVVI